MSLIRYATVTAVNENKANLKFDGESTASSLNYHVMSPYTAAVGDRIITIFDGTRYIILGKVG